MAERRCGEAGPRVTHAWSRDRPGRKQVETVLTTQADRGSRKNSANRYRKMSVECREMTAERLLGREYELDGWTELLAGPNG